MRFSRVTPGGHERQCAGRRRLGHTTPRATGLFALPVTINAYLNRGAAKAGDQYSVNVSNASNLQIMQGSAGGSQSWTQQLGASERQQVSDLAEQILEQVDALSRPEPRVQEIRDAAGQIRDARDDEDVSPGKIRALVGTITTAALSAMGTAAGTQILELSGQIVAALPG